MPYPNWHAARIVDPGKFIDSSFRNKTVADGIELILGKKSDDGPMETQAVRFDKDKFTPEEARKWLEDHDYSPISFEKAAESADNLLAINNIGSFAGNSHSVTLQQLGTSLPYKGTASGLLEYSVDNFHGTESAWDNAFAVFVPKGVPVQHVDHTAFANDPHREAQRLGYRIAGCHSNTAVANVSGKPLLTSDVIFTDAEAEQAARLKQLSLSTGFDASIVPEGKISGKVVPNHVLYFYLNEPTACKKAPCPLAKPNDPGAKINNLSESTMTEDEIKGLTQSVKELIGIHKENPLQKKVDNLTEEMDGKDAEIEALKAEIERLKAENAALKADKQELDNLRAGEAQKAKDLEWQEVKNLHQPGLFHKEKETTEREAYEANPAKWLMAHVGNLQTVKAAPAKGAAAVGNLGDPNAPVDIVAARGKLNPITGRFE